MQNIKNNPFSSLKAGQKREKSVKMLALQQNKFLYSLKACWIFFKSKHKNFQKSKHAIF